MQKNGRRYSAEFRRQMVELVRCGRGPAALAREFEPSEQTIRNWVAQVDRDEGRREDGMRGAVKTGSPRPNARNCRGFAAKIFVCVKSVRS